MVRPMPVSKGVGLVRAVGGLDEVLEDARSLSSGSGTVMLLDGEEVGEVKLSTISLIVCGP